MKFSPSKLKPETFSSCNDWMTVLKLRMKIIGDRGLLILNELVCTTEDVFRYCCLTSFLFYFGWEMGPFKRMHNQ